MFFFSLGRKKLRSLNEYYLKTDLPGIKLDANELPNCVSEPLQSKITNSIRSTSFNRYPDSNHDELKRILSSDLFLNSSGDEA